MTRTSSATVNSAFGKRGEFKVQREPKAVTCNFIQKHEMSLEDPATQSVLAEFQDCAIILCVILSVLNRPKARKVVEFNLREFQAPQPTQFYALKEILSERGLSKSSVASLESFYRFFERALPSIREITNNMPNGFDVKWIDDARGALTAAAQVGLQISQLGNGQVQTCPRPVSRPLFPAPELQVLLRDALLGLAPCWTRGRPALPNWRKSNDALKRMLNSEATLTYDDKKESVFVKCVSRVAFSLEPAPRCKLGTHAQVELPFGRTFRGILKISTNTDAEFLFDVPLPLNDPLISAG